MQLVQASDASQLSGLSPHQLREWCGRRAVLVPDVPAAGRGRHALFSWQTILALRILLEIHDRFGAEVGAWRVAIGQCRDLLRGRPFPGLWGVSISFPSCTEAQLVEYHSPHLIDPLLTIPLAPHLEALALAFSMPENQQLPLFSAVEIRR
jgi:hypothetical protein